MHHVILNEAINFEKKVIFVAIPKNGTTSVRSQLVQRGRALVPNPHLSITQIRDSIYTFLLLKALGQNRSFPSREVQSDEDVRNESKLVFSTFFKFSGVRNPWARAFSLFMRREGIQTVSKISFEQFCENLTYASDTCMHPTLHRNQFDWLCDKSGNCLMDYVFRLEEFDLAVDEISRRSHGRLELKTKRLNSNPKIPSQAYREVYSARSKRLIAERFARDIELFKYQF